MDCNLVKDKKAKTIVITAVEDKDKIKALQRRGCRGPLG
jgi:diaminohydroxyphosphoribosylaminopyrimidine deaminase/5-amino-6-(5-phosphoribosylamino)uracil reductase